MSPPDGLSPEGRMRAVGGTTETHLPKAPEKDVPALKLRYGFDALARQPLGTIVKGTMHAGSVTLIYGPPKSGKSFLATDMALSITDENQTHWMDHKIVRHGPMLYVACEGHSGFWKRLAAYADEHRMDEATFPKGFILATGRPTLIQADAFGTRYAPDPSSILAALAAAKQRGLDPVGIVIDTVFRSFGVGNVNASPDMNVYMAAIAELTDKGYAVVLVHHEIKSGGTPAGSVSLIGGADTVIHVWRETETSERRFWQVEMAKDDCETEPRGFALGVVDVGADLDGEATASCVVRDTGAAPEAALKKSRGRPVSDSSDAAMFAGAVYDQICNILADPAEGDSIAVHPKAQPVRAIRRSHLRATINQAGILDPVVDEADRTRVTKANERRFNRALTRLKTRKKVALNEQWVGLAK
jgi:hypothetical protein